jgi:hypothetical protein
MRVEVPQFSLEVPEGWGWPALGAAAALSYGVGWAVAAGLVHRVAVRRGPWRPPGPLDAVDISIGAVWPALLVAEALRLAGCLAWRAGRVPVRPFAALARRVAGDTCPRG